MNSSKHIAIIGAGIVGVSCALWLQKKGYRVTLIDGNPPGSITSSGNACTIADYGCIPVNNPALVKQLPKLLFSKNSPLSVNPLYALTHLPWMLSFLNHCRKDKVQHTIHQLGSILGFVNSGLDPLIKMTDTDDLFVQQGCMYVYQSEDAFINARPGHQIRAEQGCEFQELDRNQIAELEPNLSDRFIRGALFNNSRSILNPQQLVTRYFQHFVQNGGQYKALHASSVNSKETGIRILLNNGDLIDADKIVIAAGAFSKQIIGSGAEKLPLDTERGYHIQYANRQNLANRPIAWYECGFYATPMNEGLRFAGTVEIAGLSEKKNKRNIDFLSKMSRQMFDLNEPPTSDWLGYRPTFPDALPVIGPSQQSENIYYALGHQHIGLTLAGITGKLISQIIEGEEPDIDVSGFSASRF